MQRNKKQIPDFVYLEAEIGEDPDKRNYIVCSKKIESAGYQANISIHIGIFELIKGYQILRKNQFSNV